MTEWFSIEQAAQEADLSSKTFRRLLEKHGIEVQALERKKRISRENLDLFIEKLKEPYTQDAVAP